MDLLDLIDKPWLPDIAFFYLEGKHHQVAHAKVLLGISIGGNVTVTGWKERIRIVSNIEILDLQRRKQGGDQEQQDNWPAELHHEVRITFSKLIMLAHTFFLEA